MNRVQMLGITGKENWLYIYGMLYIYYLKPSQSVSLTFWLQM